MFSLERQGGVLLNYKAFDNNLQQLIRKKLVLLQNPN